MFWELEQRYNMIAEVYGSPTNYGANDYETYQDPLTGEIKTRPVGGGTDQPVEVRCQVRAIIDGGIRVAGTTETFNILYDNVEYLRMVYPIEYNDLITKRSVVTSIRNRGSDSPIWRNEESGGGATVFEVQGPSPVVDPFGKHIENYTLLKRRDIQS